jgi:hypothetical protein
MVLIYEGTGDARPERIDEIHHPHLADNWASTESRVISTSVSTLRPSA